MIFLSPDEIVPWLILYKLYTSDESPAMTHSVDDVLFFMTHYV